MFQGEQPKGKRQSHETPLTRNYEFQYISPTHPRAACP